VTEELHGGAEPACRERVDVSDEDRNGGAVGRDAGASEHEAVAGVEKSRDLPVGHAQVDVLATGIRQQCTELGKAQGAQHRDSARGRPGGEHQGRRADRLRHRGALQEHPGADADSHDQRRGGRQVEIAPRLQVSGPAWAVSCDLRSPVGVRPIVEAVAQGNKHECRPDWNFSRHVL
jgi:hypothetical protein